MKSKELNKKNNNCNECRFNNGKDCIHKSNKGIKIKYREETEYIINPISDLNQDGKCKNYAKA